MTMFGRDDWTLFRNLSTLGQKAGVPRERLAALALKELADNALDAGAKCSVDYEGDGWYSVVDDGPGINGSDEEVAALFSIKRPLTSTKLYRLPTRGALGNGLRVVAGTVLACGGSLTVETKGRRLCLRPMDDGHTEVVEHEVSTDADGAACVIQGTTVRVKFAGELVQDSSRTLRLAKDAVSMRGVSRYEGLTSPHWYDSDSFFELLNAAGEMKLGSVLDNLQGMKQGLLLSLLTVDQAYPTRNSLSGAVTRAQADALLAKLRENCKPPKPQALGEVGVAAMTCHGYAKKFGELEIKPGLGTIAAKLPVVVEAWAERSTSPRVTIMVNRTPVTARVEAYEGGKGHNAETVIYGCGLHHRVKTGKKPVALVVCVTTPYMQITTDGKEPNLKPLFSTISEAVVSACRKARLATSEGKGDSKKSLIYDMLPRAVSAASGGGQHRFSLRQTFYAMRPLLQRRGIDELDYGYFSTVVGQYEHDEGTIKGMYRDARGIIYHPHTRETIALGTLNVEKYRTPRYRFNKVLFVEKGGFFELLKDAEWPERHDCALMTSQGFASDAARDLCDLLGDTDQEIKIFCVHDSDGPGTCIYQTLVEGTKSRRRRLRVEVINLGLDPREATSMGLAEERVERKKGKVPVADYIKDGERGWHWEEWLQSTRIELNAMTSPQFLRWLDEKMSEHDGVGKVVPPRDVLRQKLEEVTAAKVREAVVARILARSNVEEEVRHAVEMVQLTALPNEYDLDDTVRDALKNGNAAEPWEKPIEKIAERAAREFVS